MKFLIFLFTLFIMLTSVSHASTWELWDDFLVKHYQKGRIIDNSDPRAITTSEGQSYALFFSLVANDQKTFDEILNFTENNLASKSFKNNLPAWIYGTIDGEEKIIDANNATDSDLWIAYSLLEASRIWGKTEYKTKALNIIDNLKKRCIYKHTTQGEIILPAANGFIKDDGSIILNQSYYPPFILERIALENPDFITYYTNTMQAVLWGSMQGFAADWTQINANGKFIVSPNTIGSYNAIRVYLWLGMTSQADPNRQLLLSFYQRLLNYVNKNLELPEIANLFFYTQYGNSNVVFDTALVPIANERKLNYLRTKLYAHHFQKDEYYAHVLALFAEGYDNHRFSFNANGTLQVGP